MNPKRNESIQMSARCSLSPHPHSTSAYILKSCSSPSSPVRVSTAFSSLCTGSKCGSCCCSSAPPALAVLSSVVLVVSAMAAVEIRYLSIDLLGSEQRRSATKYNARNLYRCFSVQLSDVRCSPPRRNINLLVSPLVGGPFDICCFSSCLRKNTQIRQQAELRASRSLASASEGTS